MVGRDEDFGEFSLDVSGSSGADLLLPDSWMEEERESNLGGHRRQSADTAECNASVEGNIGLLQQKTVGERDERRVFTNESSFRRGKEMECQGGEKERVDQIALEGEGSGIDKDKEKEGARRGIAVVSDKGDMCGAGKAEVLGRVHAVQDNLLEEGREREINVQEGSQVGDTGCVSNGGGQSRNRDVEEDGDEGRTKEAGRSGGRKVIGGNGRGTVLEAGVEGKSVKKGEMQGESDLVDLDKALKAGVRVRYLIDGLPYTGIIRNK